MDAIKKLFILLILIFLLGCAQKLPQHDSGYGMIAMPYHIINRTQFSFLNSFEWISSTDDRFSVKVESGTYNKDVALSDLIPAGSYTVDSLVVRSGGDTRVETYRSKQIIEIEYPFTVDIVDGVIMLAPYVLKAEQSIESEAISVTPAIHEFDDEDEAFYSARLRKREGFSQWRIEILGEGRDITEAKVIEETGDITETFEENIVACELPIYSVVGGSRIIKLTKAECVERKGTIIRHIKPLPSGISSNAYINCRLPNSLNSVVMKAASCLDSGGEITE